MGRESVTAEGRALHERVDKAVHETRRGVRMVAAMPIRSLRLGVAGVADMVELHDRGRRPYPVEYKRGRPKEHRADEVQLCAQAMCLEEMFATVIPEGALFYGKTRRRKTIIFDEVLRNLTERTARETGDLLCAVQTPPARYDAKRCDSCSLKPLCLPERLTKRTNVAGWLARQIETET